MAFGIQILDSFFRRYTLKNVQHTKEFELKDSLKRLEFGDLSQGIKPRSAPVLRTRLQRVGKAMQWNRAKSMPDMELKLASFTIVFRAFKTIESYHEAN